MSASSSPRNGSATPTKQSDDDEKVVDPDFTGKWRLKEYIGIDEYLKSEGWSWMMRKAISKLGCYNYIYHHQTSNNESITIKNVNKGGVYEQISNVNLNDKKEIKYKDKSGDKIISVFKWNKSKTEIIEFLLKTDTQSNSISHTSSHNESYLHHNNKHKKRRIKKKQKSYTKCRYIVKESGYMIESITNQNGKTCVSVYIKEDDITIKHLKNILHLKVENEEENNNKMTNLYDIHFPLNIYEIIEQNEDKNDKNAENTVDDDEKLNLENIKIQKEIQELHEQIAECQKLLKVKQEELQQNIAKNDEVINVKNTIKKWKEFESEWYKWDTLYFIGWLRRIKWKNGHFEDYDVTKIKIDKYSMMHFKDGRYFKGRYLIKFDRDAIRQIGVEDEEDSFCVYQQIRDLIQRYPIKRYQSPLTYEKKKKNKDDAATLNGKGDDDGLKKKVDAKKNLP